MSRVLAHPIHIRIIGCFTSILILPDLYGFRFHTEIVLFLLFESARTFADFTVLSEAEQVLFMDNALTQA